MNQYEKANLWEHRKVEDGSRQKQLEQSTSERGQCIPATFSQPRKSNEGMAAVGRSFFKNQ